VNFEPLCSVDLVRPTTWLFAADDESALTLTDGLKSVNTGRDCPAFLPRPTVNWAGVM
jgi:hypothetical protein